MSPLSFLQMITRLTSWSKNRSCDAGVALQGNIHLLASQFECVAHFPSLICKNMSCSNDYLTLAKQNCQVP